MNRLSLTKLEFMFALPSVIIGVSILSLPTTIAKLTAYSDGWIAILMAGIIATIVALLTVKIAAHFPGESFLDYASKLVSKPIAICLASLFILASIMLCAMITRTVSYIAQQYLFDRTPLEVIGLAFLLVVIYGVAGTRIGLFQLNILFFPIILTVFLIVGMLNIKWMDTVNFFPLFQTEMKSYVAATLEALTAFIGLGIGLFYLFMIRKPFRMTKHVLIGMGITILFYVFVFLLSIGVFGNIVTRNLTLPVLQLALRIDIPGAIFERVDAFVYVIWIMAIFNSITIIYDVAVLLFMSMFKNVSKPFVVIGMAPVIFFIGMFPKSMDIATQLTRNINIFTVILTSSVVILFYFMIKWKGIRYNESS